MDLRERYSSHTRVNHISQIFRPFQHPPLGSNSRSICPYGCFGSDQAFEEQSLRIQDSSNFGANSRYAWHMMGLR
ncbi:hypothetical protein R1flu_009457 [Riccia fluitans]|uniref:Uncharacterized protein n=1 Tax=Riccia fluitans TaxID=41844 RepID=A0ABD1Z2Z1_9MARC